MLELKNITIALSQTGRELISGFSFTLNRGEKAVIIGEEGNGKSTLLQYIYSPQLTESYCQSLLKASWATCPKCWTLPWPG